MTHPNRSKRRTDADGRTPTPAEIKEARERAGLTQTQAARLIYVSLRTWQQYEAEDRRMHPAFWEHWNWKVALNAGGQR